jgi:hypothetical protein
MATQGHKEEAWRYADKAMSWSGWGSTVGLGLLILFICGAIYRLYLAGLF